MILNAIRTMKQCFHRASLIPRYILYHLTLSVYYPIKKIIRNVLNRNALFFVTSALQPDCAICLETVDQCDAMYNVIDSKMTCVHITNKQFHADCINKYIFSERNTMFNGDLEYKYKYDMRCKCPLCRNEFMVKIIQ